MHLKNGYNIFEIKKIFKMKKILLVTDTWIPQVNGVVTTWVNLKNLFIEKGYSIEVMSISAALDVTDVGVIAIDEFTDEIEGWVIDSLKAIGCDTAKSVLEIPPGELVSRTDLEIETVEEVISIFKSEFDDLMLI